MDETLRQAVAKYGDNPPRFLWKHLPKEQQRKLVLRSIAKELKWLGYDLGNLSEKELERVLKALWASFKRHS